MLSARMDQNRYGEAKTMIVCSCRINTKMLYFDQGRYVCSHCHKAEYQSQHLSKARTRLWQAARLRIRLNGSPNDYKLPPRPRGRHRKRYLRLSDRIASLEQRARRARKRSFDTKLFAYHLI